MRAAASVVFAVLLGSAATAISAPPVTQPAETFAPQADRIARYRADLALLVEQLPQKHIRPFTRVSRETWLAAAAGLDARLPELASDHQFMTALGQLVALIGDGHTTVKSPPNLRPRMFPFIAHPIGDGHYVVAALPAHEGLIGSRLVRIGDTPIDEAAAAVATTFSYENESWKKVQLGQTLTQAEPLHALGVISEPDRAAFKFVGDTGNETTVTLDALVPPPIGEWVIRPDAASPDLPISRQRRAGNYWYEYLPEQAAVYLNYARCADEPDRPFAEFTKELLALIDDKKVQRVVIDLRRNGGGNSAIMQPLVSGLRERDAINQKGRIFVLIGRRTFSSAQLNARDLRARTEAILIGEPTGQKPNAFGEVQTFTLPGTGAVVQYSTKYFRTEPDSDPPSMMPDVLIEPTAADHFEGRDPVFDAAMAYPPAT
jgi:hypothetical protein